MRGTMRLRSVHNGYAERQEEAQGDNKDSAFLGDHREGDADNRVWEMGRQQIGYA
jgi:hypothetical protein